MSSLVGVLQADEGVLHHILGGSGWLNSSVQVRILKLIRAECVYSHCYLMGGLKIIELKMVWGK